MLCPDKRKKAFCNPAGEGPRLLGYGPFLFFLSLSLVGLFATGFLSHRHLLLIEQHASAPESALCRPTATINCDAVLQSRFAVLFDHFASSAVGLAGFAMMFWLAANGLMVSRLRKHALMCIVFYLLAAIVFSAYYSYLLLFEVDFLCTWCIVVHVLNAIGFCGGLYMVRKHMGVLESQSRATLVEKVYLVSCALLGAGVLLAGFGWKETSLKLTSQEGKYEQLATDPQVIKALVLASPDHSVPIEEKDPVYGSREAPYAIVLFTDLQCPVCLMKEIFLKAMVDLNPEHLRLVIKNYPLSTDCNPKLSRNLHPLACQAATAAYASFLLGGDGMYWQYTDLILSYQKKLEVALLVRLAVELGLSQESFTDLLRTDSPAARKVRQDVALGLKLGLDAAPVVFFLGKKMPDDAVGLAFMTALEELIRTAHPEASDFQLRK